jgi:L-fuconolactonase
MRIIDAHVHTLDNYEPMAPFGGMGRYDRLLNLMDEAGVEKALMLPVVQPFSPDNNAECAAWARQHPDRLATLADVPLHEADAADRIRRATEQYAAVGTSYYPNSADLSWMLGAEHEALWQAYIDTGIVCNLHLTPTNYATLLQLAERYPQVRFTCNHLGLPGNHFEPDAPEYEKLLQAASLDNVFVKVSAFYHAAATPWDMRCPRALGFFDRLLAGLGPQKLLWGSDWPPTSRHLSYRQSLEIIRTCATGLDDNALRLVLGENTARVFGI